jgi:hypothetical protein
MIRKTVPAAILLAVAAITGCGSSPAPASTPATPAALGTLAACKMLRADMVANGGTPDQPTLQRIVDRARDDQVIQDAQLAIANMKQDQQDGGSAPLGFTPGVDLLTYDCRQVGVQLPSGQ